MPSFESPQTNLCQAVVGLMGSVVTKYNCMTAFDLVALAMDRGCETADEFNTFLAPSPRVVPIEQFGAEIVYLNGRTAEEEVRLPLQIAS